MPNQRVASDWAQNWQGSLPLKVTAIVLWALVLAGMIVTAVQLRGLDEKIKVGYERGADRLAFFTGHTLQEVRALSPAVLPALARYNESPAFSAIELEVDGARLLLGEKAANAVVYRREIPFRFAGDAANVRRAQVTAYHPPLPQLVAEKRRAILVPLIAGFLVFGLLLALILRFVLTRPFGYMVATARAITQGELSRRFDTHRTDEFGYLSTFFNRMLDTLEDQQRNLKDSLHRVQHSEAALFEAKERAQVTLHSIADGVITTDARGYVDYLNPVAERLTGWTTVEARGMALAEVFNTVDEIGHEAVVIPVDACVLDNRVLFSPQQTLLVHREGHEAVVENSAAPIRDRHGHCIGMVIVFHDLTEAHRMAQKASYEAAHDALTGLVNRREFERRLEQLISNAKQDDKQHALLYLDLDQFKVVNDILGHAAGDELLRDLAVLLQQHLRASDTLARLGGDEFGVLLEGCPLAQAQLIADKLRQAIRDVRFQREGRGLEVSASFGVVGIDRTSESHAAVMSAADAACYTAKDKGRNRVQAYVPDDTELAQRQGEMRWVQRITQALEENRFVLYQQTLLPLGTAPAGLHFEVLVRMIDEQGALVAPGEFIPAAERYNLMSMVDRWVLQAILADPGVEALARCGGLATCAINLSGQSLCDDHFAAFVVEQLERHPWMTDKVCFEITETAAIGNLNRALRFISILRAMGCRFSLDDFGSGLSSFKYLANLNVDYLKIDGSFIKAMSSDPAAYAIVEAINEVGHVMSIKTVAEFVEDQATLTRLETLGMDYAQGFGIAKPQPLSALATPGQARVRAGGA
jgi:diguanylate cyclase (GGDEF)-like protein/PAS domain S-box-containing protein